VDLTERGGRTKNQATLRVTSVKGEEHRIRRGQVKVDGRPPTNLTGDVYDTTDQDRNSQKAENPRPDRGKRKNSFSALRGSSLLDRDGREPLKLASNSSRNKTIGPHLQIFGHPGKEGNGMVLSKAETGILLAFTDWKPSPHVE